MAQMRRPRRAAPMAVGLGAIIIAGLTALVALRGSSALSLAAGPAPVPTVDARLVIRPRTEVLSTALSGGVRVAGTVYPDYPGRNTVSLSLRGVAGRPARTIALAATMPGMGMAPLRVTLWRRGGGYSGVLALPMFGLYRVEITVRTATRPLTGTLTLLLPLGSFTR